MEQSQARTEACPGRREFLRSAAAGTAAVAGVTGITAAQSDGQGDGSGTDGSEQTDDTDIDYREEDDDTSVLQTLTPVDFAVGGGSGLVMAVVLYTLARRRNVQLRVKESTADDKQETAPATQSQQPQLDDQLDSVKRKIKAARVPYEDDNYERALDLCDEALLIAEDAIETARTEAPHRLGDVQALHQKADRLRQNVWQTWNEQQDEPAETGQDAFDERLDTLREKISAARTPYEDGNYERALDRCDEAIYAAEDTMAIARIEAPGRLAEAESLHDMATQLRENVWRQWTEQHEAASTDTDGQDGVADGDETPLDTDDGGRATDPPDDQGIDWHASGGADE
jgi:hypothetical protein